MSANKVKFYPLANGGDVFQEGDILSYMRHAVVGGHGVHLGEIVRRARDNEGKLVQGSKKEQWKWEILENPIPNERRVVLGDASGPSGVE